VIHNAIKVARISMGEETEAADDGKDTAAGSLGRKGGKARAEALTKKHCQEGVCWLENVNPWLEHTGDVANLVLVSRNRFAIRLPTETVPARGMA
jgi:hypothetical protein